MGARYSFSPTAERFSCRWAKSAERKSMTMPEAVGALSDPADFKHELSVTGYRGLTIECVTHDYELKDAALV